MLVHPLASSLLYRSHNYPCYVGSRRDITLPREIFQILKTHFSFFPLVLFFFLFCKLNIFNERFYLPWITFVLKIKMIVGAEIVWTGNDFY